MRFIHLQEVAPGDVIGMDVYDPRGQVVLSQGAILTKELIYRLSIQGYPGVYIDDEVSKGVELAPVIPVKLRGEAMAAVADGDVEKAMKFARYIIEEVIQSGIVSLDLADLRSYDDYTYAHSVNVAVLSCLLGLGLKLSEEDLNYLVIAALLHDIGKYQIPEEILNKPDRLTKEEYMVMQKHAEYSYEILSDRYDIPVPVKNAVHFHHENVDGSGYPLQLSDAQIPQLAKILHVADVYDALTSDRPYKKAYTPWEAAEYLMGACGIMFDLDIVNQFIQMVPIYPKGSEIVLSNGQRAVVLENSGPHNLRPVVRTMEAFFTIDLMDRQYLNLTIYTGDEWDKRLRMESEQERDVMVSSVTKKRLLVVDDMKTNLAILRGILGNDYAITTASSGQDAVNTVATDSNFDLILMDIDMPVISGIEATRRINDMTNSSIPVLFVTALRDKETVIACRELNAAGYIARPYQPVYVKSEVDRIVSRYSNSFN